MCLQWTAVTSIWCLNCFDFLAFQNEHIFVLGVKVKAKDKQRIGNSDNSDHTSRTYDVSACILVSLVVLLQQQNGLSTCLDRKCCSSDV